MTGGRAPSTDIQPIGTHRRRALKSPAKKPAARTAAAPTKAAPAKGKAAIKPPPAAKKATKPIAKAPVKAPVKVAAKPAAKPVAQAAKKTVVPPAKKTAAAAPAKKTPAVALAAAKPAAKPVAKPVAKPPAAPAAKKAAAKPAPVKVAPKVAPKPAPKPPAVAAKPAPVPPPAPIMHVTGIVKAVRPSSRLVQITVPSMAQSVASNAAKSSFLPTEARDELHPLVPHAIKKDPKLAGNWKKKAPGDLSDDELIAMPDSEYMNDVQMTAFRLKLVALKNGILSNAGETTEHLREDTSVMPDPADRATIEEEHALELRTRDRERKLLKKIEQAISRIDANEYGYCDETGEPIGVGRLLARPTATLSLEAQQRRELKQKMFGD
ncbi:MAG: RNA polymerase-binding protein DksA [Betaproteobacteria bacterium]|nr:RNA polymerase-binding protein DksA [Betaproteobacteria bacterium]